MTADIFVEVESGHIEEVANILADHELVSYVACSIGERDLSVQVIARDNSEVYSFATTVIGKMPGVRKTTTSIVPLLVKDVYQWRIPDTLELKSPKPKNPEERNFNFSCSLSINHFSGGAHE